ncbi:tail protein X [Helicobacter felis]|uniref:tail protein X n=1 Tax=Helicobacter felis TaxID=214 RepID=UPI000CEDCAC5|nr:tail protein X [Helicobacter felis]
MNERVYTAVQGDRWDSIYYKHYGDLAQNGYKSGYNAFLLANVDLLDIDVFEGGERVVLPVFEVEEESDEIKGPWE